MAQTVTLVFDIGKTNKKLFLFNENLSEVYHEYIRFDEIPDDEGYMSEDLPSLSKWIKESTDKILNNPDYDVKAINFSTYGASMVHVDQEGNVIAPFYNYTKPFPDDLKKEFFEKYHGEDNFSVITASPSLGFLNSGLQLYYLKYKKPELYKKLYKSLHFPQYVSLLLTGKFACEYTSLGCHTGLWDFRNNTYSHWVVEEGFEQFMAPTEQTSKVFQVKLNGKLINVGVGVHDSSSALVPYIQTAVDPFVLISTGTWSIAMNFFNDRELTKSELQLDCLNFLGIKGHSIKASRLFLGQEIREQAMLLGEQYNCEYHRYKTVDYDDQFKPLNADSKQLMFKYNHLRAERFGFKEPAATDYSQFKDFDEAYHQLMHELTELQVASLQLCIGASEIKDVYIDGGFSENELFTQMLTEKLPQYDIYSTDFALGSALGAALLVNLRTLPKDFLRDNYRMKIHKSSKTVG
ncbi:MAG: sugar kinase [Cyclobacteriaceae bacterium]